MSASHWESKTIKPIAMKKPNPHNGKTRLPDAALAEGAAKSYRGLRPDPVVDDTEGGEQFYKRSDTGETMPALTVALIGCASLLSLYCFQPIRRCLRA